jgi:parallel beta-helix repeat protein
MKFEKGSVGILTDSIIESCGWNDFDIGMSTGGILVESDDVIFENCTIQYNYFGIILNRASTTISNSTITGNFKDGLVVYYGDIDIIGTDIHFNSQGMFLFITNVTIKDSTIEDNGDGISALFANVNIENTSISSNNFYNCNDVGCQSTGEGLALNFASSEVEIKDCNISDNDEGIILGSSVLEVSNTTFEGNSRDAIESQSSEVTAWDNLFKNNLGYGVRSRYSPISLHDSNTFVSDEGEGRVIVEWSLRINVTDSYGDRIPSAHLTLVSKDLTYMGITGIEGSHLATIAEYIIMNDGQKVDYNPYTVTATKEVFWTDENYTGTKSVTIHDDMEMELMIPLYKPNLRIDKIEVAEDPVQDEAVQLIITFSNIGNASAKDVEILTTQILSNNLTKIINVSTVDIDSGSTGSVTIDWIPAYMGDITVKASIDPSNFLSEEDEENNVLTKPVSVEEAKEDPEEDDYFWMIIATVIAIAVIITIVSIIIWKRRN